LRSSCRSMEVWIDPWGCESPVTLTTVVLCS
jgi:hypothetical protein